MNKPGLAAMLLSVVTLIACAIDPVTSPQLADDDAPPPVVDTLLVSPGLVDAQVGDTATIIAVPVSTTGQFLPSMPVVFSTSNSGVATVSSEGLLRAVGAGFASIEVNLEDSDTIGAVLPVTVSEIPPSPPVPGRSLPSAVVVTPQSATVDIASSQQFTARIFDQFNVVMPDTFPIEWSVDDLDVANVSPTGLATAISDGTARVEARMGLLTASAELVGLAPPPSPPPPPTSSGAIFTDDFESGGLGSSQSGYGWGGSSSNQGGAKPLVTSDNARSGTYSLRYEFGPNGTGEDAWSEQRFTLGDDLIEVWVEYYLYYPDGSEGLGSARFRHRNDSGSDNNKFFRIWGNDYSGNVKKFGLSTLPGSPFQIYAENNPADPGGGMGYSRGSTQGQFSSSDLGRWVQVRLHLRLPWPASASNGTIEMWKDGELSVVASNLDVKASGAFPHYWNSGYILGWANSGFDSRTFVWVDDVAFYASDPGW